MTEHVAGNMPEFSDGDATGVAHRVLGTTVPVLEVQLQPGQSVISQGGELSWMSSNVQMATATSGAGNSGVLGVLRRAVAGGTIFMSQYSAQGGPGTVTFAAKMPGHIMPIHVDAQSEYMVSRHGFHWGMATFHPQTLTLAGMAHAMIPYLPAGEGGNNGGGFQFKLR